MVRAFLCGGGGITHDQDPDLDESLMTMLPRAPLIGYIGMANDDAPDRLERVVRRFGDLGGQVRHLPKVANAQDAIDWAAGLQAIYVGGGNTARLLDLWRATGIDRVLIDAARRGVVLSGVSAGAVAWFDFALWDGNGAGYQPLAGLGLIKGSCCPHFTTEPERASAFCNHLVLDLIPAGYAIGDGAALIIEGEKARTCYIGRPESGVWHMSKDGDAIIRVAVPPMLGNR